MAPLVSSMSAQELARYRLIIQGRIPRVVGGIQEGLSSRPECSGISVRALSDVIHNQVWDAFDQFFERFFPATVAPVERRNLGGRCSQCGCVDSPQMQLETPAVDIAANQPAGSIRTEMVPVNTEAGGPMELTHDMDSEGSNSMEGHNLFDNPLDEETVGFSGNDAAIGNIADLIFSEEMTRLIQDGNFQGV